MYNKYNQKQSQNQSQKPSGKRKLKNKLNAVFFDIADTSFLTLLSMIIPTIISILAYKFIYGPWFWQDLDVYSGADDLFGFYITCSLGYLVSIMIAWVGGITNMTKVICLIMFVMIIDNLVMSLDAIDLATWESLETLDSAIQLVCGSAFMLIGALCLIMKLLRCALLYSLSRCGF